MVKDPRTVWFLDLWMRSAAEHGIETSFVTMLRHPAEIVASARKSYGPGLTTAGRASAWINLMLQTEYATRGARRAFVGYEDLLADWVPEVRRIGTLLGSPPLARLDRADPSGGRRVRRPDAAPQPRRLGRARRAGARARPGRRRLGPGPAARAAGRRHAGGGAGARRGARGLRRALRGGGGDRAVVGDGGADPAEGDGACRGPPRPRRCACGSPAACPSATGGGCAGRSGQCAGVRRMAAVPKISVVVPVYNVEDFLTPCLESLVAQTVGRLRGRAGGRRLDRRQRRDRRGVRGPRRPLPDRQPGERRPQQGPQHRHGGRRGRVPRVPRQRRHAPAERVRAAARRAGEDRLGLRERQRAPA